MAGRHRRLRYRLISLMRRTARAAVKRPIDSIALVTSIAYSLANFRGPLIASFVAAGIKVYALAPDHDEKTRAAMIALGAEPVDFHLERAGTRSFVDLNDAKRLYGLLRRLRPDAVFGYFIKPVIYGSIAAPIVSTSDESLRNRCIAAASSLMLRTGTLNPLTPSRTVSRHPGASVVTTGRPIAIASWVLRGMPSR